MDRLEQQLRFLVEADKVKHVVRHNPLADGSRRENDAEHMWHLALAVLVLSEHAAEPVDVRRVLAMVLVHDLVEIDTGDVLVYDDAARAGLAESERIAADRIFGLLPDDQGDELRALWLEFEQRQTVDARFAAAIDRLQPVLLNHRAGGGAWRTHQLDHDTVHRRNAHIADGSPVLWDAVQALLAEAWGQGRAFPVPPEEEGP